MYKEMGVFKMWNERQLKELQDIQLEILIEFDRICRVENINYQLFAGTLLGAVRHNGFIPWDDDIDVCMLRDDYERFLKVSKKSLDNKFFVQNYETDPEFHHSFTKIRKNNTLCLENNISELNIHHGIFIDIFPLDYVKFNKYKGFRLRLLRLLRTVAGARIDKSINLTKNYFKKIIKRIINTLIKITPKPWLDNLENNLLTMYNGGDYVAHLTLASSKDRFNKYLISVEDMTDSIELEFEGKYFWGPRRYDKVLTRLFGNYMIYPPKEEQRPHHDMLDIKKFVEKERGL